MRGSAILVGIIAMGLIACGGDSSDAADTSDVVGETTDDAEVASGPDGDITGLPDGDANDMATVASCEEMMGEEGDYYWGESVEDQSCWGPNDLWGACTGEWTCDNLAWWSCYGGCAGHYQIDCNDHQVSCSCVDGALQCTHSCAGWPERLQAHWDSCPDPYDYDAGDPADAGSSD